MDQVPKKSGWRWVWRIAIGFAMLLVLAIGAGILYLKSLPMPDPQRLTAADARYRQVRALFPSAQPGQNTTQSGTAGALPPNQASTSESLQLRCDQLFSQMMAIKYDPLRGDVYPRITQVDLDAARMLAALYDQGVRVSPEARRNYRLSTDAQVIQFLAKAILLDLKPDDTYRQISEKIVQQHLQKTTSLAPERFARYVQSLKFLRVANCPVLRMGLFDDDFMKSLVTRNDGDSLAALPPELANFDVELLAPRRPMDWDGYVALELDYYRDICVRGEKLLHVGNAFEYFKNQGQRMNPDSWFNTVQSYVSGAVGAIITPPKLFAPALESELRVEQAVQNYAAAYKKGELTPQVVSGGSILHYHNEQVVSRLEAAAIELRRGAVVPSPDQIGPDSYFFDPITQRPYMFQMKTESPNVVRLSIRRPIMQTSRHSASGTRRIEGWEVFSVYLPPSHPGLAAVPKTSE